MQKKAEAYRLYNDAAITQMIIEKLPEIANAVASPLAKTEKIVVIDNGNGDGSKNGAAKVTGYVSDIIGTLPETIEAMTGIDVMKMITKKMSGEDNGSDVVDLDK